MKYFSTLFLSFLCCFLLPLTSQGQTTFAGHDSDEDGCIGTNDLLSILSVFGTCNAIFNCGDLVTHDGYDYSTLQIGDQCWFSENCRYLPCVSTSSSSSTTTPYYYVYGYEGSDVPAAKAQAVYDTFGVLYNWTAIMVDGICPSGWHIPTDLEFQYMEMALGMSEAEAGSTGWRGTDQSVQMRSTSGWEGENNGTNSSGLNCLPAGYAYPGGFDLLGSFVGFWTSSSSSTSSAWRRYFGYSYDGVFRNPNSRSNSFSARCIQN